MTPINTESIKGNAWRRYTVNVPIGKSAWVQQAQDLTMAHISVMRGLMKYNEGFGGFGWWVNSGVVQAYRDVPDPFTGSSSRVRVETGEPYGPCLGIGVLSADEQWNGKFTFTVYGVSTNEDAVRSIGLYGSPGVTVLSQDGGPEAFIFTEADFYGDKNEMVGRTRFATISSIENASIEVTTTRGMFASFSSGSMSTKLSAQTPDGPISATGGACYPILSFVPLRTECYGPRLGVASRTKETYRFTIEQAENDPEIALVGADLDPWEG